MQNNIDPTREDVIKVVEYINEQFSENEWKIHSGKVGYFSPCTYVEHDHVFYINLLGALVWNSDNDDRDYIEEDTKVDLLPHILSELEKITVVLSIIK
jgi:nucleoside-specific outer membrane channel protein Tsx